jgi:hypothetical protein
MATEFRVRRGPASDLFIDPTANVFEREINPSLRIEVGCWYLTSDTAELFLGVRLADGSKNLKRINGESTLEAIAEIEKELKRLAATQTYTAGSGLILSNNEFTFDTSVIATVDAVKTVKEIAEAALTAQEVSAAIDEKIIAAKTELSEAIASKVDAGTIVHATDGTIEGVVVDGTTLKITVDAYTKAETREYVASVVEGITGGESAAEVLLALNSYKTHNDARIATIEDEQDAQHKAIIATQASVADALAAANDAKLLATNTATTVEGFAKEDARLAALIADLNTNKANLADVYTKAEADETFMSQTDVDNRLNTLIAAVETEGNKTFNNIQALVKGVDENAGDIAELLAATSANTAKLTGINTTVAEYIDEHLEVSAPYKASDEITISNDGTLGLGEVNVSKLVQDEGSFLILNGGELES